jgi:hypothetical protein
VAAAWHERCWQCNPGGYADSTRVACVLRAAASASAAVTAAADCQAGVVALRQPFVIWARQAKVTLRVTQIIHDAAAPAPAAGGSSSQFDLAALLDVAVLHQGSELHIAPKPRVPAGDNGSTLVPGRVQLPNGTAAPGGGAAAGADSKQQQQQHPKPVWLRVLAASSSQQLLRTLQVPPVLATSSSSSSGSDPEAGAGSTTAAAITSWMTTAVHVSGRTAEDLALQPGGLVRVFGSTSISSASSVLPLPSLVVLLLVDDALPWGHLAVSPPLQQCLGMAPHQYAKVQQLGAAEQLQQLPGFVLHPLLPAASSSASLAAVVGAAAATGVVASSSTGAMPGPGAGNTTAGSSSSKRAGGTTASAALQQQQQRRQRQQQPDSFTGIGLLQESVKGLIAVPLKLLGGHQHEDSAPMPAAATAAAVPADGARAGPASASASSSSTAAALSELLLDPSVVAAALAAWLQLQCRPTPGCEEQGVTPMCGPLVMHLGVHSTRQQEADDTSSAGDHLLLLIPHVDRAAAAAAAATAPSAVPHATFSSSQLWLLPGRLVQPAVHHQQPQPLQVHVAGALSYTAAAAVAAGAVPSAAAAQHSKYVSCLSTGCAGQHHQQQPTGRQRLSPDDYPWLHPALQACRDRLQPRLDLLTWQAWQAAGLPLPGGPLLVGASDSGRGWLLQLLGQAAAGGTAVSGGAHVLKVSRLAVLLFWVALLCRRVHVCLQGPRSSS